MTPAQKRTLGELHRTGTASAKHARTWERLMELGYVVASENGFSLTKKGLRIVEGRAGGSLPEVKKKDLRAHFKQRKAPKAKRDRATTARQKKEHLEGLEKHIKAGEKKRATALGRILGPSGTAGAVKIAKASGEPFTARDVDALKAAGWEVGAAGTVNARPGTSGVSGVQFKESDFTFKNPNALGPYGTARALILVGQIRAAEVDDLSAYGYDVSSAPKRYREEPAPVKNPKLKYKIEKVGIYYCVVTAAGNIVESFKTLRAASDFLGSRERVKNPSPGEVIHGPHATAAQRIAMKKAIEKARSWFGADDLVTPAQVIDWNPPRSAVHIGQFIAIEYLSDKFDGTKRIYRHEVTKVRQMLLSPDGSTIIVDPPFKITRRGIEG